MIYHKHSFSIDLTIFNCFQLTPSQKICRQLQTKTNPLTQNSVFPSCLLNKNLHFCPRVCSILVHLEAKFKHLVLNMAKNSTFSEYLGPKNIVLCPTTMELQAKLKGDKNNFSFCCCKCCESLHLQSFTFSPPDVAFVVAMTSHYASYG